MALDPAKIYPSMSKPDGRATKKDGMYPVMKAQQAAAAAAESIATKARREGWRRAEPKHFAALHRYTGMAGRYDIEFDDPNNPEQGAWIRQREQKEGLAGHGIPSETGEY